ncbi:MAG: polysaccharide deacetylase family protein [Planctomycetota bacterium]|jgi:peptidoglycan/xylan/chitin deacetylase (PgdA/CDA1 family)|nr:polysaccharide deacetylase family protein [Planctomycetota bacterium]
MQPFLITTSWDDGHPLDLRVAELVEKYGQTATFYVPRQYMDDRLSDSEICDLAERHEVGSHTLTHPNLPDIDLSEAKREIVDSKTWLEDLTGRPISTFCYPRGLATPSLRDLVAEAGYGLGRTVETYHLDPGPDLYCLPTTLHLYPYPVRPITWKAFAAKTLPFRTAWRNRSRLGLSRRALLNRRHLVRSLLDKAAATGGVWHLWGHSWEIERYDLWDFLEEILELAASYETGQSVTNSGILERYSSP